MRNRAVLGAMIGLFLTEVEGFLQPLANIVKGVQWQNQNHTLFVSRLP
jgi:hypothetical protein